MKKTLLSLFILFAGFIVLMAFTFPSGKTLNPPQDKPQALFTEDLQKLFETSCFDCHSDASSNAKAKLKLNFTDWADLSDAKKVSKIENINEVISKGDMPPGRYLEKFPDKAITKEQKDLVNKWATEESNKLMGQ